MAARTLPPPPAAPPPPGLPPPPQAQGEISERVFQLTRQMIYFNDADYTAWQLRWECCQALGSDLAVEDALAR